ncbi:hypothetical protein BH24DEI1_BH24DEI1_02060 [soil metagenome]|nr:ABC transporter permease [Deinococcota bacterium]
MSFPKVGLPEIPMLNVMAANIRKVALELWRYLPNTISMILTFYAFFLAIFFGLRFGGDPVSFDANVAYAIVSYAFWFLAIIAMQGIGWEISNEAMRGTLEQLYMSPVGTWKIMLARMTGSILIHLVIMAALLVLSMLTARQWLNLDLLSIAPIMLFTLLSMVGIGFMIAGLSILYKQIQAFLQIVQFVFFGLTFVSISALPPLELAPFVKGVDMVRGVMTQGLGLASFSAGDWLSLVANALVYFALGLLVFRRCEALAMRRGLLGHY